MPTTLPALTEVRPELAAFARLKEAVLRDHEDRGGWKNCESGALLRWLYEKVEQLHEALADHTNAGDSEEAARSLTRLVRLCAHIGNLSMMIADVRGGLELPPAPKWVFDGVPIPAGHSDSRGPFHGNKCYLDALVSLLSRNTSWEPVKIHIREEELLVECRGWGGFGQGDLAYLSTYFGLPLGWGIKNWGCHPTPVEDGDEDKPRTQTLHIWLTRAEAFAGNGGDQISTDTQHYLESGRQSIEAARLGRY